MTIVGRRAEVLAESAKRLASLGGAIEHRTADLHEPAVVADLVDSLVESGGGFDVVVNAAGGLAKSGVHGLAGTARGWRANVEANLLTAVLLTEAVRPHLNPHARIVSIGSIAGSTGAGAYGAAKAALVAWNGTRPG